jgi:hypothetical protein
MSLYCLAFITSDGKHNETIWFCSLETLMKDKGWWGLVDLQSSVYLAPTVFSFPSCLSVDMLCLNFVLCHFVSPRSNGIPFVK